VCLESLVFFSHHHRHFASTTWRPRLRTGLQEARDASLDASRASGKFFFSFYLFFLQLTINTCRYAYGIRDEGEGWGCEHWDEDASTGARDTSDTSRAPRYVFSFSYLSFLFNLLMKFYYRLRVTTTKGKNTDEDGTVTGTRKGPKWRNKVSSFVP